MCAARRSVAIGLANTHPFVHGRFALVHNGTVPYFADIRPAPARGHAPGRIARRFGAPPTASICCTWSCRSTRRAAASLFASLRTALRHVIVLCREIGQEPHLGLNVLLTDGGRMVGSRWRRTLHYLEHAGAPRPGRACGRGRPTTATAR